MGTYQRPLMPSVLQQQTFIQPNFNLAQWGGQFAGHQQLFNGLNQPQLIIRNQADPNSNLNQFQYINSMGQPQLQFVQSPSNFTTNQLIQSGPTTASSPAQSALPSNTATPIIETSPQAKQQTTPSPEKKLKPIAVRPNMSSTMTQTATGTSPVKVGSGAETPKTTKSIKAGTKASVPGITAGVQAKPIVPKATSVAVNTPLGKNASPATDIGTSVVGTQSVVGQKSEVKKVAADKPATIKPDAKTSAGVQVSATPASKGPTGPKVSKATIPTVPTNDDPNIQRPPYKRNAPVQKWKNSMPKFKCTTKPWPLV